MSRAKVMSTENNPHYHRDSTGVEFFHTGGPGYRLGTYPSPWPMDETPEQIVARVAALVPECIKPPKATMLQVYIEAWRHGKCKYAQGVFLFRFAEQDLLRFIHCWDKGVPFQGAEMRYAQFEPEKQKAKRGIKVNANT